MSTSPVLSSSGGIEFTQITENPTPVVEKRFKPNERGQLEIVRLPDSVFEALGGGAAGGGKTDIGFLLPAIRQWHEHPKFKCLILRRTLQDLEKEIVVRQHEWYPSLGMTYNETKKRWKHPKGAIIQNGYADKEKDVRNYDSAEYNYIDWDESTHFTGFQYLYLSISRCRSSSPDLPAIVRSFSNPGNIGHAFFKKRFVDPCPSGRKILIDKITGQKRIYIPFRGDDNPHLLVNDPQYLKRLLALPENEKKAKLYGSWDAYEGQVFSEFRSMHLESEPANALHVIPAFPIPEWWPKILAIDWGYDAMTFVIWGAISPSGRLYIYRTYSCTRVLVKVWAETIKELSGKEKFEEVVICHSATQKKGDSPTTIKQQVSDALQDYDVRLGERDRIGGKNLVHEYLRWTQLPQLNNPELKYSAETASRILRQKGEQAYSDYLSLFAPPRLEDNLPKLQIMDRTPEGKGQNELIDVIPACVPDETNPEDVMEFKGDDPYDCLRIACAAATRVTNTGYIMEDIQRRNELQHELLRTGDQTSFYLNMERLEHSLEQRPSVRSRHRLPSRGIRLH